MAISNGKTALFLAFAAATAAAMPMPASAQEIIIDRNGLRLADPDDEPAPRPRRQQRECTPDRALDAAEDLGVRRARVVRVGRRVIEISGRLDGERVLVSVGRGRSCPILDY